MGRRLMSFRSERFSRRPLRFQPGDRVHLEGNSPRVWTVRGWSHTNAGSDIYEVTTDSGWLRERTARDEDMERIDE